MLKKKYLLFLPLFSLLFSACGHRPMMHGKYVRPNQLAQLTPNEHHKSDVEELLGTPTSKGAFDDNIWYYVSEVTRNRVYSKPKILTSSVVEIHFDDLGYLDHLVTYGDKDRRDIEPAQRHTKTAGHKMSALEQLVSYAKRPAENNEGATK
jgi:outer membrane protein assembly factor BamE (lipoprotein component of BamABCDE complex)